MRIAPLLRQLSLGMVIATSGAFAAGAAVLDGSTVTGALYYPTINTLYYSEPQTAVVGPAMEFPSGSIKGDSGFEIDITSNQLIYHPLVTVTYGVAAFNGFKFSFAGAPEIIGASVNGASTFLPSNPDAFSFTSNALYFNTQGLSVTARDYLVFDLVLADPVPEPSTWAMIILGFAGIGAIAWRRSRKTAALLAST